MQASLGEQSSGMTPAAMESASQPENEEAFFEEPGELLRAFSPDRAYREISVLSPLNDALFPIDMAAPIFEWVEKSKDVSRWLVAVNSGTTRGSRYIRCREPRWVPGRDLWESMKRNSLETPVLITILGYREDPETEFISKGLVRIRTSKDAVEAPIMFRRVPPSFSYAERHPELLEWCLADVSSYEAPRIVMSRQPYCTSCHSFSRKGEVLGMDMDYKGDKGAYFLTKPSGDILLDARNFISWNDLPREDGLPGTGLFSRISPDGNFVASTANDLSFLVKISDPYCSQLFFPIQGHLALYSRADARMHLMNTGTERRDIVETDPSWSPDSREIVFSRTVISRDLYRELGGETVFEAEGSGIEELNREYPVQFDVYRVRFNAGAGGVPLPLEGASDNGMSNYFARYSPDGRWIVFTQSRTGLILQPDSRLVIVPAKGGRARVMNSNRSRVNSWHSWSPNSRWLAFVSKENMPYTELYMTHIDAYGNDSVPVLLSRFNKPGYAINVPEFAPILPGDLHTMNLKSSTGVETAGKVPLSPDVAASGR